MEILDWQNLTSQQRSAVLARPALAADREIRLQAESIVERVRAGGDLALCELTRKLDKATLTSIRVSDEEFDSAEAAVSPAALRAIQVAIRNVRRFHEVQLPRPIDVTPMPGVRCQRLSHPIDSVGLYVPAGSAPLPSAAIMLSIPAQIAGCPEIILCTPPRPDGSADPAVLAAARHCGVNTIFKVGGAQAIAAMAYGTESIPRVAKIFGPGNAWVTAAKNIVATDVGGAAIDMPAGPSELLVIADRHANARFIASDLLSQAEHGADSQVLFVTTSADLAARVRSEIDKQLAHLQRADIARNALRHSHLLVVHDLDTGIDINNRYAPEHLILHVSDPRAVLPRVRNAGSVFLGPWSPESAGDYCSGTNHVLPTYGAARSYSGLCVENFMRHMTVQEISEAGLQSIAGTIIDLAGLEGLDAHAAAVKVRLESTGDLMP